MHFSESIAEIAAVLPKAQAKVKHAVKSKVNPHFKSTYADLSEVMEAVKPAFAEFGLAVLQDASTHTEIIENPSYRDGWEPKTQKDRDSNQPAPRVFKCDVTITTRILHASGEWYESAITLRALNSGPQAVGSAITYGRRYLLAAMAGVAQDDDDGNFSPPESDYSAAASADGLEPTKSHLRKVRGDFNQSLLDCKTEKDCRAVQKAFQKQNGPSYWDRRTGVRNGETFASLFKEHLERVFKAAKVSNGNSEEQQWREAVRGCQDSELFVGLESQLLESNFRTEENEKILNDAGERLKMENYI